MNKTLQRLIAQKNMGMVYTIPHVEARKTVLKVLDKLKNHIEEKDEDKAIMICKGMCSCIKLSKSKKLNRVLEAIGEMYAIIVLNIYSNDWDKAMENTNHLIYFYDKEKNNG